MKASIGRHFSQLSEIRKFLFFSPEIHQLFDLAEFLYNHLITSNLLRMKLTTLKTYKLEVFFIFALIILSFFTLSGNKGTDDSAITQSTFWLPSAVMQSVAALYGVFIAIFILSLQNNRDSINSIANLIKPTLKIVSYTAAGTIYFNGLILIVFSLGEFSDSKMKFMLSASLISMVLSLIAIVYSSMVLLSDISGLKTSSEKYSYISNLLKEQEGNPSNPTKQNNRDIEFCIQALEDENPEVRRTAAEVLGYSGNQKVESALIGLLEDNNPGVRTTATKILGRIGTDISVEPLIKRLAVSKDPVFKTCAIEALGNLDDKRAIEPLIKILEDKNPEVRIASVRSLGNLGDERAEEALIMKLNKGSLEFQKQVILALGKIGDKKAVDVLISKLEDKQPEIRKCAAESLGKLEDIQAVDPLLKCLEDKTPEVRNAAAYSLGILKADKAVDFLLKMLMEQDSELRITAVYALGNIGSRKSVDSLIGVLEDNNPWIRRYAIEALGKIGDQKAIPSLVKNLNDSDPEVRWTTAEALKLLDQRNLR